MFIKAPLETIDSFGAFGRIFMRKVTLLLVVLLIICAIAGCVKTPKIEIVTGKDKIDEAHIENVPNDTPQELGQPDRLTDSFDTKVGEIMLPFTVNVDADITVPDSGIYPVYSVEKSNLFDAETAVKIIEYLFAGCDTYDAGDRFVDDVMDQCRLTKTMLRMKQDMLKETLRSDNPELNEYLEAHGRDLYDVKIDMLRKMISNYDGYPFVESIRNLSFSRFDPSTHNSTFWSMLADVGGMEYRRLNIVQGFDNGYFEYLMYDAGRKHAMDFIEQDSIGCADYLYDDYQAKPCGISIEDAERYADEFMHATGLDEKFVKVYAGSTRAYDPFAFANNYIERRAFVYVPRLNDTHLTYIAIEKMLDITCARLLTPEAMIAVDALYFPNTLKIYVDSEGIERIHWRSCVPDEITGTVSENAKLMQFEDIYKIFKDKVGVQGNNMYFSGKEEHLPEESIININSIELAYYRVKSGTGAEDYVLIPVWVFYGNTELKYKAQSDSGYQASKDGTCILGGAGYAFMIINAMDGSIIDFSRGY